MILCNLDGPLTWRPESEGNPASVGMICAWGGLTVAEISKEVPRGEGDEYAKVFAMAPRMLAALESALAVIRRDADTKENSELLCRISGILKEART